MGLNGGWIFFATNLKDGATGSSESFRSATDSQTTIEGEKETHLFQSMCFEKNGCLLISSAPFAPKRFVGSRWRRPVISVIASCGMSCGNSSGSERMRWYITFTSSS